MTREQERTLADLSADYGVAAVVRDPSGALIVFDLDGDRWRVDTHGERTLLGGGIVAAGDEGDST